MTVSLYETLPKDAELSSLQHGLDLLELLAERGDARLAEIAEALGTSRATAFRVLTALKARDYVEHDRSARRYRLGPALKTLAAHADLSLVEQLASPAMADLRDATGETINLAVIRGGRIVYASIFDGVHALRMRPTVGEEVPPHATALGKAILAALPSDQQEALLGHEPYVAFTERTIVGRTELARELERTQRRGYAIDDEESALGSACIAAEILGGDGVPLGAISVSGLAARLPEQARPPVGRAVRRWCDQLSGRLAVGGDAGRKGPRRA
jgi:DNA-binding IclR family transcriptional regulator